MLFVRGGTQWKWMLYRPGAKEPRERIGGSYGGGSAAMLQRTADGVRMRIDSARDRVNLRGDLRITRVCTGYAQDQTMWDHSK
jgi:hypothetical protein